MAEPEKTLAQQVEALEQKNSELENKNKTLEMGNCRLTALVVPGPNSRFAITVPHICESSSELVSMLYRFKPSDNIDRNGQRRTDPFPAVRDTPERKA